MLTHLLLQSLITAIEEVLYYVMWCPLNVLLDTKQRIIKTFLIKLLEWLFKKEEEEMIGAIFLSNVDADEELIT